MNVRRKLQRLRFYCLKFFIGFLVHVDSRLYMRVYLKLLHSTNIQINGKPRFVAKSVQFDDFDLIELGDRLVVSSNVTFLTHDYSFTTALISIEEKPETDIGILGKISVGDNVFIGMNVLLLPGTKIGDNVIIGAGSVVRGTIPNNCIATGNPAKVVKDIKKHAQRLKSKNYLKRVDSN